MSKDRIVGTMSLSEADSLLKKRPHRVAYSGYKIYFFTDYMYLLQQNGFKCNRRKAPGLFFKLISPSGTKIIRPHLLVESDNGYCITNDHIKPLSLGGRNCIHNYQPMCNRCNNIKSNSWNIFDRLLYINNCIKYHFKIGSLTDRCECNGLLKEVFLESLRIIKAYLLLDLIDPRNHRKIEYKNVRKNCDQMA